MDENRCYKSKNLNKIQTRIQSNIFVFFFRSLHLSSSVLAELLAFSFNIISMSFVYLRKLKETETVITQSNWCKENSRKLEKRRRIVQIVYM